MTSERQGLRAERRALRKQRLEDAKWMAATGESLDGAAARLGMEPRALADLLYRHNAGRIARRLKDRNPRDHNALVWQGGRRPKGTKP